MKLINRIALGILVCAVPILGCSSDIESSSPGEEPEVYVATYWPYSPCKYCAGVDPNTLSVWCTNIPGYDVAPGPYTNPGEEMWVGCMAAPHDASGGVCRGPGYVDSVPIYWCPMENPYRVED